MPLLPKLLWQLMDVRRWRVIFFSSVAWVHLYSLVLTPVNNPLSMPYTYKDLKLGGGLVVQKGTEVRGNQRRLQDGEYDHNTLYTCMKLSKIVIKNHQDQGRNLGAECTASMCKAEFHLWHTTTSQTKPKNSSRRNILYSKVSSPRGKNMVNIFCVFCSLNFL